MEICGFRNTKDGCLCQFLFGIWQTSVWGTGWSDVHLVFSCSVRPLSISIRGRENPDQEDAVYAIIERHASRIRQMKINRIDIRSFVGLLSGLVGSVECLALRSHELPERQSLQSLPDIPSPKLRRISLCGFLRADEITLVPANSSWCRPSSRYIRCFLSTLRKPRRV